MARTFIPLSCLLFFIEIGALAHEACGAAGTSACHVLHSWTAAEEAVPSALELLQHRSAPSERHLPINDAKNAGSEAEALIQNEDAESKVQIGDGKEQVLNDEWEVELDAHHPLWDDQLVIYRDGFCQRADNAEPCLWRVWSDTLVLDWLNFPTEELHTSDEGRHLSSAYGFQLENEYPPAWFVYNFRNAQPDAEQTQEWSKEARKAAILATHGSGNRVICNNPGYLAVQKLGDAKQMEIFIRRLMTLNGLTITDDSGLMELSKRQLESGRTFDKLVKDLELAALKGAPLIREVKHFDGQLDD
mmetsp:Transcript_81699/g.141567  ORF Transcript_81699/g.141567 Transcript_81699/m.141567 type:complete len:303 (-) Transcript_81699:31-939(-)